MARLRLLAATYSTRTSSTGLILAALHAGNADATTDTTSNPAPTAASVHGSRDSTPKNIARSNRVAISAPAPHVVAERMTGRGLFALFASGLVGILSLPLVLGALVSANRVLVPEEVHGIMVAASLINPIILLGAGLILGKISAPRIGLRSMIAAGRMEPGFARVAVQSVAAGLIIGAVILGLDHFFGDATKALDKIPLEIRPGTWRDFTVGVLYGGVTEEVMMRWGVMSFIAWLGTKDISAGTPTTVMWTAIVLSSLIFGAGHLPAAASITPLTTALVIRTISLNAIGGVAFGYLYWKRNLEAAMIAHGAVHVAFTIAAWA